MVKKLKILKKTTLILKLLNKTYNKYKNAQKKLQKIYKHLGQLFSKQNIIYQNRLPILLKTYLN